jgi:general secretion pathway protein D
LRISASIVAVLVLALPGYASPASDLYRKAQRLQKAGNIIQAYAFYTEAASLDPTNKVYAAKAAALQMQAVLLQKQQQSKKPVPSASTTTATGTPANTGASAKPAENSAAPDVEPDFVSISAREASIAQQMLPPAQLKLPIGHFDFHLNADSKEVFDQIAERCGLQTQFDSEYTATPKIRLDIADVDCRQALRGAESATSSFIAPLSSKLIFISKDTPQKRQANEQTMGVVIPIPTALSTQELTEISQAVKQVSGVEKLQWSSATNEIVIRDRVSRVLIAKAVVEQLTAYRGVVMFDLRFLQLSDSDMLAWGVTLTNSFSLIWGGQQTLATAGSTLNNLIRALEHGWQGFGITALQASVVASLTQSKSNTIFQTQIQSSNGLPASLHIGEKYPVLTSGYFGPTSNSTGGSTGSSGTAYTPPPSISYQDLGVSVKVTPMIGNDDLITLDVDTEYQLLAGSAANGIPILGNRKMATRISIHNDEWAVIGGLMDDTNNNTVAGVAGLARIPVLGWLFKTVNKEKDRDHIIILMKPHIVGLPPSVNETEPMWVGTETRPLSPL